MNSRMLVLMSVIVLALVSWLSVHERATAELTATDVEYQAAGPAFVEQLQNDDHAQASSAFGRRLAGTYYTQEWPSADGPVDVIWHITADGTMVSDTAVDQGAGGGLIWGNVRGTWVRVGPRTIENTALGLGFDPATGAHVWTLKVHSVFQFDKDLQVATADQYNRLYLAGQNPLDPEEVPFLEVPLPPYTFQRVNVELSAP